MKDLRFSVFIFAVAGFIFVGLSACSKKEAESLSDRGKQGATARAERRDLDENVVAVGDLRPLVQVDVKAEVSSSKVKAIRVGIGQMVKRGDLMIELDDTDLLTEKSSTQIEIEGAQLQLNKAALAAERAKKLVAEDLITKEEADNKRLEAEISKNSLDKAVKKLQSVDDKLSKVRIMAPISGTVIELPIIEGQVVIGGATAGQGTLLMKLANFNEMLISTHINQMDVTHMKVGQPVQVTIDAFEGTNLTGKIFFIAPVATVKNNIKGFGIDILVSNPDPRIRPGMSANIKIPISNAISALSVPIEAVFHEDDRKIVYLKNGTSFDRREVEVGVITHTWAEIRSGLREGDTVSLSRPKDDDKKS